jgi:hypothetical protein
LTCAFAVLAVTITDGAFRELQARPLPTGTPFFLGVLVGLGLSLASVNLILAIPCGIFDPC